MLLSNNGTEREEALDYPPPAARLKACLDQLATELEGEERRLASELAQTIAALFDLLWQMAAPRYRAMREHGVKPHHRWLVKTRASQDGT
jgi:hypothetical protein